MTNRIEKYFDKIPKGKKQKAKAAWNKFNKSKAVKDLFATLQEKCCSCNKPTTDILYPWIIIEGHLDEPSGETSEVVQQTFLRDNPCCKKCRNSRQINIETTRNVVIMCMKQKMISKPGQTKIQWLSSVDEYEEKMKEFVKNYMKEREAEDGDNPWQEI